MTYLSGSIDKAIQAPIEKVFDAWLNIDEEARSGHEEGWGSILDKLDEVMG